MWGPAPDRNTGTDGGQQVEHLQDLKHEKEKFQRRRAADQRKEGGNIKQAATAAVTPLSSGEDDGQGEV